MRAPLSRRSIFCNYTGTHDNAPTRQWYEELPDFQRQNLWSYLKRAPAGDTEVAPALIHLGWSSRAALAVAPLQDLLNLGAEGRMNIPGQASGNWRWRCREDMLYLLALLAAGTDADLAALKAI